MTPPGRGNIVGVLVAAFLIGALGGCTGGSATPPDPGQSTGSPAAAVRSPARAAPSRVMLLQGIRAPKAEMKTRSLTVEADGTWACDNCAGDGKSSTGRLTAATNQELQRLLADPALEDESIQTRRYRLQCQDVLVSTLLVNHWDINSGDCPGEQRPPVADAILRLLADATPVEITHPRTG